MGTQFDEQLSKTRALLGKDKEKDLDAVVPELPRTKPEIKKPTEEEALEAQEAGLNAASLTAPVYKDSTVLAPQAVRGGDDTPKRAVPIRRARIVGESVQIRDFPRELMSVARAEFPNAQNNTDALAAYVYAKSGKNLDVPDIVRDLASKWEGDKSIANMEKRITAIERQLFVLMQQIDELLLVSTYVAFDRLGYRKENPKTVRDINFLEVGVGDVRKRLQEQAKQDRKQKEIRDGRPIR